MSQTKGAQRRNAYVTVILDSTFLVLLDVTYPHGWVTFVVGMIFAYCVVSGIRKLADIGFTSRADNEQ